MSGSTGEEETAFHVGRSSSETAHTGRGGGGRGKQIIQRAAKKTGPSKISYSVAPEEYNFNGNCWTCNGEHKTSECKIILKDNEKLCYECKDKFANMFEMRRHKYNNKCKQMEDPKKKMPWKGWKKPPSEVVKSAEETEDDDIASFAERMKANKKFAHKFYAKGQKMGILNIEEE